MNATAQNNSETDTIAWQSFHNEEFANDKYSTLTSNFPAKQLLRNTTVDGFRGETGFSVFFMNLTEDRNESRHYDESIYSSKTEEDSVFSEYPQELLCLGAICFVVFAIVGVAGNFISILALSMSQRLRNATTAFIVNLCVADLLFCSFSMPLSALTFIQKNWYYGDVLCKAFPLVRYSNGAVSLFSVIAITVNRYVLIVHPKMYSVLYTKRNMAIMISLIWVLSLAILLPPLLGIWGTLGYDPAVGTCTILKLNGKSPKMFLYIAAFGLPSIIFVLCYVRIFLVVRKTSKNTRRLENRHMHSNISFSSRKGFVSKLYTHSEMAKPPPHQHRVKSELRVLRVMLVVFMLFIGCYFPVSFVKIFHKEDDLHILNVLGYLGVYFSNIVNPLIYIVMSAEYRRAYKELFCNNGIKGKSSSSVSKKSSSVLSSV